MVSVFLLRLLLVYDVSIFFYIFPHFSVLSTFFCISPYTLIYTYTFYIYSIFFYTANFFSIFSIFFNIIFYSISSHSFCLEIQIENNQITAIIFPYVKQFLVSIFV